MKFQIPIEKMRERKIFVATPMYGGQCSGMYAKSCLDLSALAAQYGIEMKFFYLFNESLITRARNYLVDEFLRSGCTHLMFIDSDINFNPQDVLALAAIADPDTDRDIVCGPYPKKCIAWERIAAAVQAFPEKVKKNPAFLEQLVGDFVFNPVGNEAQIAIGEPVEVLEGGTGFMMIQRRVFDAWDKAYPEFKYTPDHNRSEHFGGNRQIMCYFDTVIENKHNRYLSEDYMFCQWSREIGIKLYMCPWMQIGHTGSYTFHGNIPAIAQVPGATHGGVLGSAPAISEGHKGSNHLTPPPQVNPAAQVIPPPPVSSAQQTSPKVRSARRREAALKRREEKKRKRKDKESK